MSNLITLSKENWAQLREPGEVSERLRRPISAAIRRVRAESLAAVQTAMRAAEDLPEGDERTRAAAAAAQLLTDDEQEAMSEANDYGIVALVAKWSLDTPVTLDSVLDLPAKDYDRLRTVVAPLVNQLFVDAGPDEDPASPTQIRPPRRDPRQPT